MNNYKTIIILHALDSSTHFLSEFKEEFNSYYHVFTTNRASISQAKTLIGDLKPKSLIVFLGHGSSSGLYEPDSSDDYENYFLDATWGNHYFDDHDVFLLSCRSNEYIKKLYKTNFSVGFGNIISSKIEVDLHNKNSDEKKTLNEDEINQFNSIYVRSSIKIIKRLVENKINFHDIPKYFRFYLNKEINIILLNKENNNRIELSRLLFEFRNEITLKYNIK
jgi:hypothetical protein